MNYQQAKDYLLSKSHATYDFPFGKDVTVFRVTRKMFATLVIGTGNEKDTNGKMADTPALI